MKIALIGQPNCGKSTIFNSVAGYRVATANFPGTTVRVASSPVRINGLVAELVDVPGIYSLTSTNVAESAAKRFLLKEDVSLIINVVDASLLSRSLELTPELRELDVPMVICLNMMDDARRKGVNISSARLALLLGVPVVEAVAYRGVGIRELFGQVIRQLDLPAAASDFLAWHRDVEAAVVQLQNFLGQQARAKELPSRFLAIKLLENDEEVSAAAPPEVISRVRGIRANLERTHGRPAEWVIMSERHDRAMRLSEESASVGTPRSDFRAALDNFLTHPLWGYVFLLVILVAFFWAVFGVGSLVEGALAGKLSALSASVSGSFPEGSIERAAAQALLDGFTGGAGIVLPYLVPFLFGLAFLEDAGYLPRVAYLMDGLLHRMGLHGTSMLPIVLGYGCSVPACMATRILPSQRDRFIASVLATLVPCSARSTVIFALVAFYLGPLWALGIFCFNALVVIASGLLMARLWPEVSPGMVLEVPRYQWPALRVLTRKVWLRLREFVVLSWPLLIAGSLVLGLATYMKWDRFANAFFSPLTGLLGLPAVVGTTLIFGLLRKELALIMLAEALGTRAVLTVLSPAQIVVFTVFITFYIPCLATLVALAKEIGTRMTALAAGYALALATIMGLVARAILNLAQVI